MITQLGMGSEKIGRVEFDKDKQENISPETKRQIELEIKNLIDDAFTKATDILSSRRVELDRLANALLKYETLTKDEIELVVKGKPISGGLYPEIMS
jgi:ATP-dependent metalloprotease